MRSDLLKGFAYIQRDGGVAWVRPVDAEVLAEALFAPERGAPAGATGRGQVYRVALRDGAAIVRPYLRGGAMRHFLREGYLWGNRPRAELEAHAYCFRKGLPVPEPLGAAWRRRGLLLRGAFATRELNGQNLHERLRATAFGPEAILEQAGATVRAFHDAGVFHADLQLRNFFVTSDERVFLLDFDGARVCPASLHRWGRIRNLLRLRRSFEKNGASPGHFEGFMQGYGAIAWGWWDAVYRVKGQGSDWLSGRAR